MNFSNLSFCYDESGLKILDQTLLPHKKIWIELNSLDKVVEAVQSLRVRGAPLIAIVSALFIALELKQKNYDLNKFLKLVKVLKNTRPTAVNLMNIMNILKNEAQKNFVPQKIIHLCEALCETDRKLCSEMAITATSLIPQNANILTHCNTGALATAGVGTALGAIYKAHEQNKNIHVYVGETRPLLQGGRLTTWELEELGIHHTLICDNMAAVLMAKKKIDLVLVGADRIAKNGDFANKTGTYSLAVLAHYHQIPFCLVAPSTTLDPHLSCGKTIPIEQRVSTEVRGVYTQGKFLGWTLGQTPVYNPSFDVTPAHLVSYWIIDAQIKTQADWPFSK